MRGLITQCTLTQIAIGLVLLSAGMPIYLKYSPKKETTHLKEALLSSESITDRADSQEERFLSNVLRHMKQLYRKIAGRGNHKTEH